MALRVRTRGAANCRGEGREGGQREVNVGSKSGIGREGRGREVKVGL